MSLSLRLILTVLWAILDAVARTRLQRNIQSILETRLFGEDLTEIKLLGKLSELEKELKENSWLS